MHTYKFIFTVLAALALSFVFLPSLSAQTKANTKAEKNSHAKIADASPASKEIMPNGDLVEFAALWIKPSKQEQLNQYYSRAFPIAVKYGARWLAGFVPVNVYRGDLDPQLIGLNQWPSLEAFRKFIKDDSLQKLLPLRDEALSRLVVNHNGVSFEESAR